MHDEPTALDQRVTELEIRTAFQEDQLRQLDEVVQEFARRVVALERELAELRAVVIEGPGDPPGPGDEPPPHY